MCSDTYFCQQSDFPTTTMLFSHASPPHTLCKTSTQNGSGLSLEREAAEVPTGQALC